jgi:hypothetical protein
LVREDLDYIAAAPRSLLVGDTVSFSHLIVDTVSWPLERLGVLRRYELLGQQQTDRTQQSAAIAGAIRVTLALTAALLAGGPLAQAQGISTAQIMTETISALPSCLNYSVTGVCFFLRCYLFYCTITTSIKVQHYMPDDVVSTYSSPDQHPWIDVGKLFASVLKGPGDMIMGQLTDAQADTWPISPRRATSTSATRWAASALLWAVSARKEPARSTSWATPIACRTCTTRWATSWAAPWAGRPVKASRMKSTKPSR